MNREPLRSGHRPPLATRVVCRVFLLLALGGLCGVPIHRGAWTHGYDFAGIPVVVILGLVVARGLLRGRDHGDDGSLLSVEVVGIVVTLLWLLLRNAGALYFIATH